MSGITAQVSDEVTSNKAVRRDLLIALLLPLFFVLVFPLIFVGALHQPTPHDLSLVIAGPSQVVSRATASLDGTKEFSASQTDVVSDAALSVKERHADGAIAVEPAPTTTRSAADAAPSFAVTTYVAGGGGRSAVSVVEAAGDKIASQLGTTAKVVDVAPLAKTDPLGTTLFFLLVYTSLGSYLVIIVLTQIMPRARLATKYLAAAITSLLAPLVVFGLSSIWVGDYGASFGTIAALLAVNSLYSFTIGGLAIFIEQILGKNAAFGVMALIVFLNFPSAGGASPASMLPPFWQFIHNSYFGAGAYESFRSIVYFGGNDVGRWLFQLSIWTIGIVLITVIIHLAKLVRAQGRTLAAVDQQPREMFAERIPRGQEGIGDDDRASSGGVTALRESTPSLTAGPAAIQ